MHKKYAAFSGRMLMVGFGAVGQGSLPLILRHLDIRPQQITIVTANEFGKGIAAEYGIKFLVEPLRRDNYTAILARELGRGDFLVNVSIDVSSVALIDWCQQHDVFYIVPASSPGPAAIPMLRFPPAAAPTTLTARRRWRCARSIRRDPRACSCMEPIPAWCRIWSSRRC
jgi:homospermidine synthase